ncbi:hypothetical protein CASFOL_016281 [Castilleja foliolosa]|uniref:Uncharacterized protein n=1 Tax=Castilleja foliolosa TaxID=1961234 RepID=A0ABD3DGR8_9LAMI
MTCKMSNLHKSIYNSKCSSPRELNRMNTRSDDSDGYLIDMNKLKLKEPGHGENEDGFHGATGAPLWCSKCGNEVTAEKYDLHSSYCKGKGTENEDKWTEITDTWESSWGGGEGKKGEEKEE